jgi:aminoglycoside phosphotransferase (APT) family kinase protein
MAVRLPRIHWATGQPVPLGRGEPAEGYPWSWSVYRWLKGENPTIAEILADQCKT